MQTILNFSFEIKGEQFDYKKLILECLNATPEGGFDYKELKLRMRIENVVNSRGEQMDFEDADYRELRRVVLSMRWNLRNDNILKFISLFE